MSKKLIFTILALSTLSLGSTIFASSSIVEKESKFIVSKHEKETVYDLQDLSYEIVDPQGNIVKSGPIIDNNGNISTYAFDVAKATITAGNTTNWYPTNSPSGFYLQKDDVVEISLKLSKAVRIKIALTNGNSKETTDKNPSVSLIQSKTGYSKMSVTNLSSASITVNGGSISYNE
ncbi:MAG: hypothetical protein ACLTBU_06875 [Zhenhengia sp.]|uniref:hypothetical protein n=1 Tax=Zhenhengia sp. TaxID=2944208 RepID=UPI003993013E